MYYVYVLISLKDLKLYIGWTKNLKSKIKYHAEGLNKSTKYRKPLKLIYYEAYVVEKDAREREKFLKSGRGHEVIYKQLTNTLKVYR